jgi:Tfp pilus assembly protein PilP
MLRLVNSRSWTLGIVVAAVLHLAAASAVAQVPDAAAAINAAKDARVKTEAAQKKNSEALDPQAKPPAPSTGSGQAQPPAQTPPATPPAGDAQQPEKTGPGYSYDPAGRRDPFVSLLGRGGDLPSATGTRPVGLPGVLINEVTLKGVLKSGKGDYIALLQSPDNHTFIVHSGDKVMDGMVKTITQDAIVFSQDVNDPLSVVKQREVRKTIRPEAR